MQLILLICLMYIVLGCFLESMSMVLLTLPIVFPVISAAGFDPVWFGVLMITLIEIALITPPVGMNVYMMSTLLPQVPLRTIFSGVAPFVAADVVRVALLIAFPAIAVWLPSLM
jgi:TRAP-type C4-dicarboxylate transport system permease large subunit